jgi:hexosaminidase
MLCTAWDDRSPHFETYWHGFITSAEYSWSPGKRLLEDFDQAYLQREHGITFNDYVALYFELRKAAIFWERSFMLNGSRLDLGNILSDMNSLAHWLPPIDTTKIGKKDYTNLLIKLPDHDSPGTWSEKYNQRLNEAETIINEYKNTASVLDGLYKKSKRNRYHWKVFSAVNDFQLTAPKLMVALKKCDTKDSELMHEGIKDVKFALKEFSDAWENLQKVYSETRFLAYPSDYVPDRYFHFASHREDLTWMVQVEEMFHTMVSKWLNELEAIR